MDKSMVKGIVVGAVAVTALAAGGVGYKVMTKPVFAEVVAAKEVKETVKTPREECEDKVVTRQEPVKDKHKIAGTVLGAVAGGVLGNVIGGGGKNTVAKIAGAAAGGYAGNKTQEHLQENDTYQTTERVCKTVYDESERTVAYNVDYKIGDVPGKVRLDHDPGDTIPVQDGQLVIARESRANESGTQ